MKRRNALFSFHPGFLTGRQQRARGRVPYNRRVAAMLRKARGSGRRASSSGGGGDRSDLVSALVNLGYKRPAAKQAAARAIGSDFDSMLRDSLKSLKNPRSRATMQKKKKRNRKRKMPAGLRKYWAKKRKQKAARRRKRVANPKVRRFRPRVRRKAKSSRRRRRNPVRRAPRMVKPPFPMTSTQLKKYARALARATGKRVQIKRK